MKRCDKAITQGDSILKATVKCPDRIVPEWESTFIEGVCHCPEAITVHSFGPFCYPLFHRQNPLPLAAWGDERNSIYHQLTFAKCRTESVFSYQSPAKIVDDLSMPVRNDVSCYTWDPENDRN
jgi:hypothetical protein